MKSIHFSILFEVDQLSGIIGACGLGKAAAAARGGVGGHEAHIIVD